MSNKDNTKNNNQFGHTFAWDKDFKGRIIVTLNNNKVKSEDKSE